MKKLSKMDEEAVATIAHESAPRLLMLFKRYHDQTAIGADLLDIFKMWTNYDKCKTIFCNKQEKAKMVGIVSSKRYNESL